MAYEQNIDDVIKLLTEVVEDTPSNGSELSDAATESLSDEALKLLLQKQFASAGVKTEASVDPYALDPDFLAEAQSELEAEDEESEVIPVVQEEPERIEDEAEEQAPEDEPSSELLLQMTEDVLDDDLPPWEKKEESEDDDLPPWEEPVMQSEEDAIPTIEIEQETFRPEPKEGAVLTLVDDAIEIVSLAEEESTLVSFENEEDEFLADEFPEIQTTELSELLRDYQSEEDVQSNYFSLSDQDAIQKEMESLDDEDACLNEDYIEDAIFDLMQQLGCEDELSEIAGDNVSDEMLREVVSEEERDVISAEMNEAQYREYQKKKTRSMIEMAATGAIALFLLFYELIPFLGGEFAGIFSHRDYAGAYLMIGFQVLLLSAVFLGRPLLTGIRRIVSLRPDLYSVVSLMLIANFLYDLTVLLSGSEALPSFHSLTALMICSVTVGEHLLLIREIRAFSIYATESGKTQYTLMQSEGKGSIAAQMYMGGLDQSKKLYLPMAVESPKGFLESMRDEVIGNRVISVVMLPSILLSIVAMVVSIFLNDSIHVAAITLMIFLFATIPLNAVAAICIPLYRSASRLHKRGIALTEKKLIDEYAACDMVVYHDLHLFKPCSTKDTGIVFYEQDQMISVLGALQILYATIEGPMADVFADVPEAYRFKKIRIRRIFRNGIEAFVDQKMILLVGDALFMQRYGLDFPTEETVKGRSTLCISLNGKVSAKMSVQYTTEPIFEMLAERLCAAGVQVVIETFDPMLQAGLVASARQLGDSPISVFHKSVSQLKQKEITRAQQSPEVGVLVTSSRLKLAEALIWSRRLYRIRKLNNVLTGIFCAFGAIFAALALGLGWMEQMHQYWLLLLAIFPHLAVVVLTAILMPKDDYFSVEACQEELSRQTKDVRKKKSK